MANDFSLSNPSSDLSLGSMGLQFYSSILQGQGQQASDDYQAQKLEEAATYGDLKAVQTSAQMTRNLNQTLGNIDAVRAAAGTDPSSPTGQAIRSSQEAIGNANKAITVNSITAQSLQDRNDAAYYQAKGNRDMLAGIISGGAGILKGLSSAIGPAAVLAAA